MVDESRWEAALEAEAAEIDPGPELWDRVRQETQSRRQGLRLKQTLEVVAACLLLVGLIAVAAWRPTAVKPGGGSPPTVAPHVEGIPAAEDVARAYVSGTRGINLPLTLDSATLDRILGWLRKDEATLGIEPQPSRGGNYQVVLELKNGGTMMVRSAADCTTTNHLNDGSEVYTCHPAEGEVLVSGGKQPLRLRLPELSSWLTDGLQQEIALGYSEMQFTPVIEPTRVSADQANTAALNAVGSLLERPARFVTFQLARYDNTKNGPDGQPIAANQLVWKFNLYGTRTRSHGGKAPNGPVPPGPEVLDRSFTWVLVDASTGEVASIYSTSQGGLPPQGKDRAPGD